MSQELMSVEGQLVGMPLAGPESFSQQQLDYLKRALGVDETVLYESSSSTGSKSPITLSENWANFKKLRFIGRLNDSDATGAPLVWEFDTSVLSVGSYLNFHASVINNVASTSSGAYMRTSVEQLNSTTGITHLKTYSYSFSTASTPAITTQSNDAWGQIFFFKVIGVGRINGGN